MDPTQPTTQTPVFQPKPNYLKTIILSVLGVFFVVTIIYLYLQNQNLQKQIINQAISPTIQAPSHATQTVSPTPKTTSSISIPPEEMEGWKAYKNDVYGFSFSYPKELSYFYDQLDGYVENGVSNAMILLQNFDGSKPRTEDKSDFQIVIYVANKAGQYNLPYPEGTQTKDVINNVEVIKTSTTQKWISVPTVIFMSKPHKIAVQLSNPNSINKAWFDQILLTFKFTSAN